MRDALQLRVGMMRRATFFSGALMVEVIIS